MLQEVFRLGVARLRGEVAKAVAAGDRAAEFANRQLLANLERRWDYFELEVA